MELELNGTQLSGYAVTMNTTLFSEETMETIVPDACPDILQVLTTRALLCVRSKEVREGRVEMRGTVYVQVLYLPDGEEELRHIEVNIPFSGGMDHAEIQPGSILHVSPGVLSADARVLNPRKVYIRTEIALKLSCYTATQKTLACHCAAPARLGVEQKKDALRYCLLKSVHSKPFVYSDTLSLPGSKSNLKELLSYHVAIPSTESRIIGNKLVFKGQTRLNVLYWSEDKRLCTAEFELPFSQIMEVDDGLEEAECDVEVILTDITCKQEQEDGRTINVAMNFMAQAAIHQNGSAEILSDLYSTGYDCSVEFKEEEICRNSTDELLRQEVREVVEIPVPAKGVVDFVLSSGDVRQSREGHLVYFEPDLRIEILYQGEDGRYYVVARPLRLQYKIETTAERYCAFRCCCTEELVAPTSEGIELRFSLELGCRSESYKTVKAVQRAMAEEENRRNREDCPSVVLRMTEKGEGLWDIAKAYFTTIEEIMQANDLTEHAVAPGRILLIPKKR